MTVPGYLRLEGDCAGHDLKQTTSSRLKCGYECSALARCKGYLYIIPGSKDYRHPPCHLKKKMCETPINVDGLNISAYFKNVPEGKFFVHFETSWYFLLLVKMNPPVNVCGFSFQ